MILRNCYYFAFLLFLSNYLLYFAFGSRLDGVEKLANRNFRIVGGAPSKLGQFPGQVSIQLVDYRHFCGGTLIDLRHVLTAAHCVFAYEGGPLSSDRYKIMAGDVSIMVKGHHEYRVYRRPDLLFVHTDYNPDTHIHDIAIIRLADDVPKVYGVLESVPLTPKVYETDFKCSVSGWGVSRENASRQEPYQLFTEIFIMDGFNCVRPYYKRFRFGKMICAGVHWGGKDSCQGDSGGGLICNNTLTGIVSFGYGCGRVFFPGVYTNVLAYRRWVNNCITFKGAQADIPMPYYIAIAPTTVIPTILWLFVIICGVL